MSFHRHDPAKLCHPRMRRWVTMRLLAAALCSMSTGLMAKQPDTLASASSGDSSSTAAFHALAVHQDYIGIWMTAGEASEDAAKARVLEACRRDTDADTCQIAHSGQRNYLAVGYAIDGGLEFMAQNEPAGLTEALEAKCTGRFGSTCMVIGMVGPAGAKEFPADPTPAPRRRYAAIAGDFANWVKGNQGDRRVWVVTGAETRETAQQGVRNACERELGQTRCQLAESNGDKFLLFYQSNMLNFAGFLSENSPSRALAEMNRRCGLAKVDCHKVSVVPVQQPSQYVLDLGVFPQFRTSDEMLGDD